MAQLDSAELLTLFCLLATQAICGAESIGDSTDRELSGKVDALLSNWDRPDSPGFAIGVIRDGKFVHKRGYGLANVGEDNPITSETNFSLMSIGKSFETACLALLIDQGALSPDAYVHTYIPELPEYEAPITIHHLLTCRSGLRDCWFLNILSGRSEEDAYTRDDTIDLVLRQKSLMFRPNEEFGYSNSDYVLLQEIMERVTGKTYSQLVTELILRPLGMTHTFVYDGVSIPQKNFALGYTGDNEGKFWRYSPNLQCVGGGQLRTTIEDMLRWDACLQKSSLPSGKHIDEFLEIGCLFGNMNCLSAFPGDYKGLKRVWYTGGGWGFHAHYLRFPEQGFSIVAFSNVLCERSWETAENVLPKIADLYLADAIGSNPSVDSDLENNLPTVQLSDAQVRNVASQLGHFLIGQRGFGRLEMHGQQLHLVELSEYHNPQGKPTTLSPVGPKRFRSNRGYYDIDLVFGQQGTTGRSTANLVYSDGRKQSWEPVEFVELTREEMPEYQGDYYCDVIDYLYRISAQDDKLFVQFNFGRKRELLPTVPDVFILTKERFNGTSFSFSRDELGRITGFELEFGRVKSLRFEKR